MTTPKALRISAPLLAAALLITSGAGDDEAVVDSTSTTSVVEQTTTTMSDMTDMEDMGGDEGHGLTEGMVTEWQGPAPQLEIVVEDGSDGRMIALNATGFEFADPTATRATLPDSAIPTSSWTVNC